MKKIKKRKKLKIFSEDFFFLSLNKEKEKIISWEQENIFGFVCQTANILNVNDFDFFWFFFFCVCMWNKQYKFTRTFVFWEWYHTEEYSECFIWRNVFIYKQTNFCDSTWTYRRLILCYQNDIIQQNQLRSYLLKSKDKKIKRQN